ncbi:MAG: hypothetical protein N0A16_00935 [Blastocatellia bacterium]|nr:hypothetical protein [Blastocatellia bacterium]MCS7156277.1 hypothetical protein [Blastocatellia bacterium]MCX7751373.1 hypothetical protein [Blastocatellia bacterium]MDW8169085.1 hypothetical protein [Acidobacteriota bacterium]MDW8255790.1 hypothetical protein [Acidobacteriota bacterium]
MSRGKKKEAILRLCQEMAWREIGERELVHLKARLRQELGDAECPSDGYIVEVLRDAGYRVSLSGPFTTPVFEEEYARQFEGVLKFDTLERAEQSLRELSRLYRHFRERGDGRGIAYARALARLGWRRARAAARRAKEERARVVKEEIAEWFALWASSPETFEIWVELRKQTPDFRRRFGLEWTEPQREAVAAERSLEGKSVALAAEGHERTSLA